MDKLKAMPELLNMLQFYYEGDEISGGAMGTLNQTFARIFLQAKDADDLLRVISYVQNVLKIYDQNGENMLLPGYDCEKAHVLKNNNF